jgi:hypothetical protein
MVTGVQDQQPDDLEAREGVYVTAMAGHYCRLLTVFCRLLTETVSRT